MARQDINLGTNANDGTGDKLRTAMKKVNENLIELYARTGGDGTQDIILNGNVLSCNGNLTITTNNTGSINLEDVTKIDDDLYVSGRLKINTTETDLNNNLLVNGNAKIKGNTTLGTDVGEDSVILNSTVTGAIIPTTDGIYDLGTSGMRFRDVYVAGTVRAGSVLFSDVNLVGGTINNIVIGNQIPNQATFTNITVEEFALLGNLDIRDNMIYARNDGGGIELRTSGGNVFIPSTLVVGVGTDTGELVQMFGNVKITQGTSIGGDVSISGATTTYGNVTVGSDVIANGQISGTQLIANIADGVPPLVVTSTTMVANLSVANAAYADQAGSTNTVTSAAQPNITSLGTLTNLSIGNDLNVANNVNIDGNLNVNGVFNGDKVVIPYIIDGGGDPITTGSKRFLGPMNFSGTIEGVTLLADMVGSIEIEIRKFTYNEYDGGITHPVTEDKISGAAPLTLSNQIKSQNSDLSGWSLSFFEGDIFEYYVNSATDITWVEIMFSVKKGVS